ncbi:MAG: AAA family ATPase, partial [Planctomycetaceae bacterium]
EDGRYPLHFTRFTNKLDRYEKTIVPRFHQFQDRKKALVASSREEMKLEEFKPRVLTSFVRNRLLDTVYLPLIGDNLAKQIGAAGEGKRTDRMGMLLLISPPGYGKTTLMEYIANRLGIIFMKINGPAIGHQVTSLDPDEARNAAAREEVNKLNLALEMGDNVMIYVDDIQHCNPEFLQKFISLCDATRKIEGVYKGRTRTYDLRGRKVAVVMAGNPYTESGEKFQIPDMLSNRADIYNLGEIIGENADAFEMSYLENCLTSNPALNNLATRSQKDVYAVIKMAEAKGSQPVSSDELEGNYSLEELNEIVAVMKKLIRVRDVILTVNREYIRSAAQSDDYRTEPPFKLQGSYRNMNRIAERVLPIMNDAELETLIFSNYENDAQTLTSDTEANLLKFKELAGQITPAEKKRWEDIKRTFQKNVKMRGIDTSDNVGRVIAQLGLFGDGLDSIRDAVVEGVGRIAERGETENGEQLEQHVTRLAERLQELKAGMQTVGESLTGGMSRLAEVAAERASQPVEFAAPAPTAPSFDPDAIRELAAEIRALAPPQPVAPRALKPLKPYVEVTADSADEPSVEATPAGAPTKITVVNKIPPTLLNVLQEQFRLMEGWMAPILQATTAQSAGMRELKERLEACLADYGQLVSRVEATRKPAKKRKARKKRSSE